MEGMGAQEEVTQRKQVADITMDLDVLDCPVCYNPLRPPVFQCTVGHFICSSCLDKLLDNGKCHLCSRRMVYNRCHMVENIIESIKVACSNANNGCTARITYYQKEDHEKDCPHAPCFCPKDGCSFSGSTMMLLDHFSSKHKWRCAEVTYNVTLAFSLQVGSMVLVGKDDRQLFLVQLIVYPFGGVIAVCCIQPHNSGPKFKCMLKCSRHVPNYSQSKKFVVMSTNLNDGMPADCGMLLLPEGLLSNTGASAIAKVGTVLSVELTPQ